MTSAEYAEALQTLVRAVQEALSPELLKPGFAGQHPHAGHCYVASEALYHALGGPASPWRPARARDERGVTHWWLQDAQGGILDATAGQYLECGRKPPYASGRRGGFLTRRPSRRTTALLRRVKIA